MLKNIIYSRNYKIIIRIKVRKNIKQDEICKCAQCRHINKYNFVKDSTNKTLLLRVYNNLKNNLPKHDNV